MARIDGFYSESDEDADAAFARAEQEAADLQYAQELQAQHALSNDNHNSGDYARNPTPVVRGTNVTSEPSAFPGTRRSPAPAWAAPAPVENMPRSNRSRANKGDRGSLQATAWDDGSSSADMNGSLLHVPCEINGRFVEMMVDTGAQCSVISAPFMKTLGLERMLNRQMQGVAAGVGMARILGRIEGCPVQIGHVEFHLFFMVLDVNQPLMILGIDQMRRFKCMIDLEGNKLVFGGKDGVEVEFLPPEQRHLQMRNSAMEQCTIS